jgi:hypothetical protein
MLFFLYYKGDKYILGLICQRSALDNLKVSILFSPKKVTKEIRKG